MPIRALRVIAVGQLSAGVGTRYREAAADAIPPRSLLTKTF